MLVLLLVLLVLVLLVLVLLLLQSSLRLNSWDHIWNPHTAGGICT